MTIVVYSQISHTCSKIFNTTANHNALLPRLRLKSVPEEVAKSHITNQLL